MQADTSPLAAATWALIVVYAVVVLTIVVRGARRTRSMNDYAVGSLLFSPVAVGLSLAASMTSAATFIINPGFVALYGLSAVLSMAVAIPLASLCSLVILTKGFRRHGATVKALSMAQWMETRYGSRAYGMFFGVLSLLLITFVVLICVGLTKVLSAALGIGEVAVLAGLVMFVFGYMMFGGANSMVYTNTLQALLMLVIAVILLGSGYEHFREGVTGFLDRLAAIDPKLIGTTNTDSFLFRDHFEVFGAALIVGVAIICQPHILTKSLLLNSERDVNRYLITGCTVQFIFFAVVFAGLYARLAFPDLTVAGQPLPMDNIVSAYVVSEFPVIIGLIVVLGLISAGLSTLESLIQSISTTVTNDIIKPLASPRLGLDRPENFRVVLLINRAVIMLLALAAFTLSWQQLVDPKLSVGIFAQNGVYAYFSAAFVPILMGMFLRDVPLAAPVAASLTAVTVHFSMYYGRLPLPFTLADGENPGVAAAVAIVASVVVGFGIYLLGRGRRAPAALNRVGGSAR